MIGLPELMLRPALTLRPLEPPLLPPLPPFPAWALPARTVTAATAARLVKNFFMKNLSLGLIFDVSLQGHSASP
jgi:hypothetical protein